MRKPRVPVPAVFAYSEAVSRSPTALPHRGQRPAWLPRSHLLPALFCLALGLFWLTSARTPIPGPSAAAIVRGGGLDGAPMLTHPLWAGLVRLLVRVPLGAVYERVHILSGLFGATVVTLTAWLVRRWTNRWVVNTSSNGEARQLAPAPAATLVAAAAMALQGPVWISATRASPELLSLLVLLVAVTLTELWVTTGRPLGWAVAAAAVAGTAVAESPAAAIHVPLLAAWAMITLTREWTPVPPLLRPWKRQALAVGASFVTGLLVPLGAVTLVLAMSPLRERLGLDSGGRLLRAVVRAQTAQFREALSPLGWLLVILATLAPAGIALWAIISPPHRRRRRMAVAAVTLAVLGAAVLLHSPLAPWPTLRSLLPSPFPSLWIAIWLGFGAAMGESVLRSVWSSPLATRVVTATGLALVLAGAIRSFPYVDDRALRPAGWLARGIARESSSVEWIISRGVWDNCAMAAVPDRRPTPRWLRLDLAREPEYLARLRALPWRTQLASAVLPIGLDVWLPLWFDATPSARTNAAALDVPEVFERDGQTACGGLWVYHGAPIPPPPLGELERWRREAEQYRALWERGLGPWREVGRLALQNASRTMNDLAVRLEELERPDVAVRAYQAALVANPDNVVAALNRVRLTRRLQRLEVDRAEQELVRVVESQTEKINLLELRATFGRLRDPNWLMERSRRLAMAGRLDEAAVELGQAMMVGGTNDIAVAAVARLLAMKRRWTEARAVLADGERQFPGSRAIAVARRWIDDADSTMERNPEPPIDDVARAAMLVLRGEWAAAEAALRGQLERTPNDPTVASLGALLALYRGDTRQARSLAERAVRPDGLRPPLAYLALAAAAMAEQRWPDARRSLEVALGQYPNLLAARRLLTIWAHQQRDLSTLHTHLTGWLRQSPKDPAALQLLADRYADAQHFEWTEAILRYLVERYPSAGHWNGLGWVLWQQGRHAEAVSAAEEAVRLGPQRADAWANLAAIRWELGRQAEALAALAEAERLSPTNGTVRARAELIRDLSRRGTAQPQPVEAASR